MGRTSAAGGRTGLALLSVTSGTLFAIIPDACDTKSALAQTSGSQQFSEFPVRARKPLKNNRLIIKAALMKQRLYQYSNIKRDKNDDEGRFFNV